MQVVSILFSGNEKTEDRKVRKTQGDQKDSSREEEDEVKNSI